MSSAGALVTPPSGEIGHKDLHRQLMQLVGRDLGLSDWGSPVNHVSYDSDSTYAHTLKNQGTGGHLNVPGIFQVVDGGIATTGLAASGNTTVGGTLQVTGATTLSSTLGVTGAATLSSTLAVTGAASLNGNVTLGDASGDTVTVNGTPTFNVGPTINGNVTFGGTSRRITADLSNATLASRLLLQTSTTNDSTLVGAIPNGTGTVAGWYAYNNATPASATLEAVVRATNTGLQIRADSPAASYLPIYFVTNNTLQASLSTAGVLSAVSLVTGAYNNAPVDSEQLRVPGTSRFENVVSVVGATIDLDNNKSYRASDGTTQRNLAKWDSGGVAQFAENGATGAVIDAGYVQLKYNGTVRFSVDTTGIGFFGTTPGAKPTIVGSRAANAALASLITALAGLGLVTDLSTV